MMNFMVLVDTISKCKKHQLLLYSATFPGSIEQFASSHICVHAVLAHVYFWKMICVLYRRIEELVFATMDWNGIQNLLISAILHLYA